MSLSHRKLGTTGPDVFPLALGCAAMSAGQGVTTGDKESVATIHEAVERGINMIDTADFYGSGHNEMLIREAIRGRRDKVLLSVKFGGMRDPQGGFVGVDSRPSAIKNFVGYSLRRLGVDYIDVYRPARLDPQVPIEETVGAMAELIEAGYVRHIGLSEVGPETIRRAHAVHPIADVQVEYSLMSRGPERAIFPVLQGLDIGATAYAVLCHGLLTGKAKPASGKSDPHAHLPRFKPKNFPANQHLAEALSALAQDRGVTAAQLATAWVLSKSERVVPVMGASKRKHLHEALASLAINLSTEEVAAIERAVPAEAVAGERYAAPLMKMLDSEN